ncbi:hypothetical protein FACS1894137_02010 [Spirochaetia bacterium]|nr:hypothetical protein FACS1894137_02010 [Spirochaetia bacterium]
MLLRTINISQMCLFGSGCVSPLKPLGDYIDLAGLTVAQYYTGGAAPLPPLPQFLLY